MATTDVKPYRTVGGVKEPFDWYMLPFDKTGHCVGPRTLEHVVEQASLESVTDVFVFSHGWNNDWNVATKRYSDFIDGYLGLRRELDDAERRPVHPLLVGVFWPSTALAFGSERGIEIAADAGDEAVLADQELQREIDAIAAELDPDDVPGFYQLMDQDSISGEEALALERLLSPVLTGADDDERVAGVPGTVADVEAWRTFAAVDPRDELTDVDAIAAELEDYGRRDVPDDDLAGASLVGNLKRLDPRKILRLVTVRQMKDRAGTVGARGVGPFLVRLLQETDEHKPRVHLIGHSYGAKVCLSAICYPEKLPRKVDSLLLLQPAVSHRCFANDDLGTGGYAAAPARVDLPILSTFSEHDFPLRKVFQFAARRKQDVDELLIAGDAVDRFAALGGYGPHGLGDLAKGVDVRLPGETPDRYELGPDDPRVYGINATSAIDGHGDISNACTWWALDNLVTANRIGAP